MHILLDFSLIACGWHNITVNGLHISQCHLHDCLVNIMFQVTVPGLLFNITTHLICLPRLYKKLKNILKYTVKSII